MQKQFEEYLLAKNYKPTTSIDYPARLERLCRKEKISYEHLAQHRPGAHYSGGLLRTYRNTYGQSLQIRAGQSDRPYTAGPRALHLDALSSELRLYSPDLCRRRRPA